jgi:arylsulfatase A-like enzyme
MNWMSDQWQAGAEALSKTTARRVNEQHLREAMALTAGMITMIDDEVGRLVAMLKASGQYENTVICFNADHGDYLGDFSLLLKGAMPFRSVTQVPMIWSDPADRKGRVTEALASTIDISASILDRVGLTPYHGMQGESFLPVINGEESDCEAVLTEFNDLGARLGFTRPARVRSLRTASWRYTLYQGEPWGELYDLVADPQETNNLWDSSAHANIKADLTLQLAHMLAGQMDESPVSHLLA